MLGSERGGPCLAVIDSFPFPVSFNWVGDGGEVKDMELFERNNTVPSSKMMTFFRNETFTLQAKYSTPTLLPAGCDPAIGQFDIGPMPVSKVSRAPALLIRTRPPETFQNFSKLCYDEKPRGCLLVD